MWRWWIALIGLCWIAPVHAACPGLSVGDQIQVTDEGMLKLSKTARWKRTGTVTHLTVRGLPEAIRIKRGLILEESIYCGFVARITTPLPTPEPAPTPTPTPEPSPYPEPLVTIPLSTINLPAGMAWPVTGGIPFPRGLAKDCNIFALSTAESWRCEALAWWPDGSMKAAKITTLATSTTSLNLTVNPTPAIPIEVPTEPPVPWPSQLRLTQGQKTYVAQDGRFRAQDGTQGPQVLTTIATYAGFPAELGEVTVIDDRVDEVSASKAVQFDSYTWELPGTFETYTIGGANGDIFTGAIPPEGLSLYQGGEAIFKDGSYQGTQQWFDGVGAGMAAAGWACAHRDRGAASCVAVKDFADQFPTGFRLFRDRLVVEFHPERATRGDGRPRQSDYLRPTAFYLKSGQAKTYRVLLARNLSGDEFARYAAVFQAGPRLVASRDWYARSGVFGALTPSGTVSAGYDRYLIDGILTPSSKFPSLIWLKGWRDFGDRLRPGWTDVWNNIKIPAFYNDTHVGAHQFFVEWLRTGDERWWQLGRQATEHWMDLDVAHTARKGYWQKSGQSLTTPPGEGHLIKHEIVDHTSRNLHWGHAHLSGLPDYYLLTGDRRSLAVLREVADWWVYMQPVFFPVPAASPHWAEAERDYGWPLFCLNEAYRSTGDKKYHEAAARIALHLLSWWQQPANHLVNGQVVGVNDWQQGTGWWTMYPRCDNSPWGVNNQPLYNGTNPWMAGALLTSLIDFRDHDADWNLTDRELVRTMILQGLNYVVKYGWETSRKWKPYDYFVYSEASRDTDGGKMHLLYPLAWGAREIQRGVANPEWYDTSAKWLPIAKAAYDDWQVVKNRGTNSFGFYGYDFLHPNFIALMQDLTRP